jgi:hypothetical protein
MQIISTLTINPIEKIPHLFVGAYLMGRGWRRVTAENISNIITTLLM